MRDRREHERIEKRVEERLGFYIHLAAYVAINLFLIALNVMMTPEYYWFIWPLIGWGVAVILHALGVFVFGGGSALRQRMIDAELKKEGLKP